MWTFEWGLRARAVGYRSFGVHAAQMGHSLGDGRMAFSASRCQSTAHCATIKSVIRYGSTAIIDYHALEALERFFACCCVLFSTPFSLLRAWKTFAACCAG